MLLMLADLWMCEMSMSMSLFCLGRALNQVASRQSLQSGRGAFVTRTSGELRASLDSRLEQPQVS